MNRVGFYKKLSVVFLIICILSGVLCVASVTLNITQDSPYRDCKEVSRGTLSSCVSQKKNNSTYYYGIYSFQYNNESWNYICTDFYTDMDDVPSDVLIKHNKFTSKEDMKATLKTSRLAGIPVIYGIVAALALVLFLLYHSKYRSETLSSRIVVQKNDLNAELDRELNEKTHLDN